MYYVRKRLEIAGAHKLELNYESKCSNLHGHNWIIIVHCKSEHLNENGMVVDFAHIKKQITDVFDHHYINDIPPFNRGINPTAENMAEFICKTIENCYRVEVQESEGNIAVYEKDEEPVITEIKVGRVTKDELMELINSDDDDEDEN